MICERSQFSRMKSVVIATLLLVLINAAHAQNTAIPWYGVSGGFGVPASTHARLSSAAGQSASGEARHANTVVVLGFLGDTLFRPLVTAVNDEPDLPESFTLHQNYPNPFNPVTAIGFTIQVSGFTCLRVYDILGREVATLVNEVKTPGRYAVTWDASNVGSGVYFYRLHSGSFVDVKRLVVLK